MEKKTYIKPEIEVIEIESAEMLAGSFNVFDEEVNTGTGQLSNGYRPGRRGQWGNLWHVEED